MMEATEVLEGQESLATKCQQPFLFEFRHVYSNSHQFLPELCDINPQNKFKRFLDLLAMAHADTLRSPWNRQYASENPCNQSAQCELAISYLQNTRIYAAVCPDSNLVGETYAYSFSLLLFPVPTQMLSFEDLPLQAQHIAGLLPVLYVVSFTTTKCHHDIVARASKRA